MKILYKHLNKYIKSNPSIEELSDKLFQLGHENEFCQDIIDLDLTPNRGDCLSLIGILRELCVFYDIKMPSNIFLDDIKELDFKFKNFAIEACPNISFLKIEIEDTISDYKDELRDFFVDLENNKNNFFTDVSNYISYETGQPTHCYDFEKINGKFSFKSTQDDHEFETLLDSKIKLKDENYVFAIDNKIVNLAGIVGDKSTSCSDNTRSVLVECAFFNPEIIIGKSLKYDIKSDAAHKFERGVDPNNQEKCLRRFISIIDKHAKIKNIELINYEYNKFELQKVNFDYTKINEILGTDKNKNELEEILSRLNINIINEVAYIPSYRSDIENINDIAEEVARVIGYDSILPKDLSIKNNVQSCEVSTEGIVKSYLNQHGFYEVVNQPFVAVNESDSIKIDNPLDSNKNFMRRNLRNSLIENLLYNERRQKDSIKLFEISDIYYKKNGLKKSRKIGIIASGRVANNYKYFQQKINNQYFKDIFKKIVPNLDCEIKNISREELSTKLKSEIIYLELDIKKIITENIEINENINNEIKHFSIKKVSDLPSSSRDISFSIKDFSRMIELQETMLTFQHNFLKDVFIFDYFKNEKNKEIKMGFRFIFQDDEKTITDNEVDQIFKDIVQKALGVKSVSIPGYNLTDVNN